MFRISHYTIVTREGLAYFALLALLLIGALVRQINLLVALYGMLAGPLVLSWGLSRRSLRGLRFRRTLPASVPAGDAFVVALEVANERRRLANWVLVIQDRIQREGPGSTGFKPSLLFSHIPVGQSRRETYRGTLVRRGRYRFGPLKASTRFPFGLLNSFTSIPLDDELLVTPRLGRLTRAWRQRLAQAQGLGGHGSVRRQARSGDFFGLRPWRPEDSRRAIHWRSTARRQTLIVRQNEQARRQEVTVVLDLWLPAEPRQSDLENVELAVSFAATLIADLARGEGATLRLKAAAREPLDLLGPSSPGFIDVALNHLATVEADAADRLAEALGDALDGTRPDAVLVLVTTRPPRLADPQRFDPWWQTPARVARLDRLITVDVSQPNLAEFFEVH